MKQRSHRKPAARASVGRKSNVFERVDTDLFSPSAVLAGKIAGAGTAIIATTEPDRPGSVLALNGTCAVCQERVVDWVAARIVGTNDNCMVVRDAPIQNGSGDASTVLLFRRATNRTYTLVLCDPDGVILSDADRSILFKLLDQVHGIHELMLNSMADNCVNEIHVSGLDSERELLSAVLDHAPDRMFVKNADGEILICTRALAVAHGYGSKEDLFGKTSWDLYPKIQARKHVKEEKEILNGGNPVLNRASVSKDSNSNELWLSVTKIPVFNSRGAISGIIGIERDITSLNQSKREIADARDAALDSARVKSSFLANMSHELRTPLNGIIGMGTLLNASPLTVDQRDIVDTIHASAENLLTIINEVLDFSKGEAGKLHLAEMQFDLNQIVNGILDLFAENANAKRIDLVAEPLPENAPHLVGDPGKIRQVLVNLVGNAIKFTDQGTVSIEIRQMNNDDSDTCTIEARVRDSGIGLPQESADGLFDPFTQADNSASRKFGGTGLGLAISKQIIERMGGQIGARPNRGTGAEFWFRLSLPRASEEHASPINPARIGSRKILVLLEESATAMFLIRMLKRLGHDVDFAGDSSQATAWIDADSSRRTYDLVMLGSKIDQSTWSNFLEHICPKRTESKPPIILITEMGQSISPAELNRHGVVSTLSRPIKQDRLVASIDDAVHAGNFTKYNRSIGTEDTAIYRRRHGLGNQRVLVVEENTSNQKLLIQLLGRFGFRADPVGCGAEAIDTLRRVHYPVVLMSCNMPEMDGFEATRKIRALEDHHFPKHKETISQIIGMSPNLNDQVLDACTDSGMNDCIAQPTQKEDLKIAMAEAVSRLRDPSRPPISKVMKTLHPETTTE